MRVQSLKIYLLTGHQVFQVLSCCEEQPAQSQKHPAPYTDQPFGPQKKLDCIRRIFTWSHICSSTPRYSTNLPSFPGRRHTSRPKRPRTSGLTAKESDRSSSATSQTPGDASASSWKMLDGARTAEPANQSACQSVLARPHSLGIIHGDINKSNSLMRDGKAVLVDFCGEEEEFQSEFQRAEHSSSDASRRGGVGKVPCWPMPPISR